jgi:peptidoglycan/LPS O-acetylase OafA/YrhL
VRIMPNPPDALGRFVFVDALRGLAALGVVIYHFTEANHIPALISALPRWIGLIVEHGNLGVPVFFVLSGFVIAHSLYSERVSLPVAGRFMLRRSLRLDPPYWVAIALTLAFAFLSAAIIAGKRPPNVSLSQVAAHILYLQEALNFPELDTVFWTLCMEIQFYLIYVLMLGVGRNDPSLPSQGRRSVLILSVAAVVSLMWPYGIITAEPWHGSFLPLWHGFLLGVVAYWSWRYPKLRIFFCGFALLVFIAAVAGDSPFSLTCVFVACLLLAVACAGRLTSYLRWRGLQRLGTISYSLYLTHNPITGASFAAGYRLTGDTLITEILWTAGSITACILVATGIFYLIERPSLRLARHIKLRTY